MWDIKLPTDERRIIQLRVKLQEYCSRLKSPLGDASEQELATIEVETDQKDVELTDLNKIDVSKMDAEQMDTVFKIVLLQRLLINGSISGWNIMKELAGHFGRKFNAQQYNQAFAVITDYCQTGGAKVKGGTGLKK